MKLKPLMPTMKERARYIVYETTLSPAEVLKSCQANLGVFTSAKAGLQHITYDRATKKGILRVSHDQLDVTRAGLALISPRVNTLYVSGMINKARTHLR